MRKLDVNTQMVAPLCSVWPFPPGEECLAAWKKAIYAMVDGSIPTDSDPTAFDFHGRSWQLPQAFLHANGGSAARLLRSQQIIDDRPLSQMALYLITDGRITADYNGSIHDHEPGDVIAVDYSLPYDSRTSGYESITITFDRASAPVGLRDDVHGMVLTAGSSAWALLGIQIRSLVDHIDGLSVDQAQSAIDGILRLAEATFSNPAKTAKTDNAMLMRRASQLALRNLGDPDFSPETLASALTISRSKLFRLFEAHGGVQRWLLAERLRASLRSIVESPERQKISAVAHNHGFRSEAHFSRAFQKRYLTSPGAVRTLAAGPGGSIAYLNWLKRNEKKDGAMIEAWLNAALAAKSRQEPERPA